MFLTLHYAEIQKINSIEELYVPPASVGSALVRSEVDVCSVRS